MLRHLSRETIIERMSPEDRLLNAAWRESNECMRVYKETEIYLSQGYRLVVRSFASTNAAAVPFLQLR